MIAATSTVATTTVAGGVDTVPTGNTQTMTGAAFLRCIEDDLSRIEERLIEETRSDIGAVRDISGHTLLSGGKRLRPTLAVLSARVLNRNFPTDRSYAAGAAAELIHMATLMHDDVVDESPERRGRPTASQVYGNGITVLTGDFLLAKSISLLAHNDDNLHIVRVFSDVTVGMAEGEVLQAAVAHDLDITQATYEEIIERKTARFLAGCCEMGAIMGGATETEAAALRSYGHHLGMAFQIADDLLDFLGDPKKTGKPLGTDLRDGRVTLPLIHALRDEKGTDEAGPLSTLLTRPELSDAGIAQITALVARRGGFEAARREAEDRASRAVAELSRFPAGVYRTALEQLAAYVVSRDR